MWKAQLGAQTLPPLRLGFDWPHYPLCSIAKFAANSAALLLPVDDPVRWLLWQRVGCHRLVK